LITRSLGPGMAHVVRQFLRRQVDHGHTLFRELHEKRGPIDACHSAACPEERRFISNGLTAIARRASRL
jgi:hypothetical protein